MVNHAAVGADIYSFEALAENSFLDGQDGWRCEAGQGQAVVSKDNSANGTKVARHHRTVVFDRPAFLTRTNNPDFSFVAFTGRETNAIMEFEASGEHVALFALGRDLNGDGLLTSGEGEMGPAFGVFDRHFRMQEANLGTAYDDGFNEGGGDGNSGNDWYRIQLRLNLIANGGDGSASLFFMNLSDGDKTFHSVSGLRNRPLGLSRLNPHAQPAHWDAMRLELLSNGKSVPSVDNLIPNLDGILITHIVMNGADVFLRWRGGAGPYQVQKRASLTAGDWENTGVPTLMLRATIQSSGEAGFFRVVRP